MIVLKSKEEIALMRESGRITGWILEVLASLIKPGMTTAEIDGFVEDTILKHKMTPAFKGYHGYPASSCVSVNEVVVHGIPSSKKVLREGDIVSVDVGIIHRGYVSDAAQTYPVGAISREAQQLIETTKASFFAGLEYCRAGNRLYDISAAVQRCAEADGFSVVRDFVGHGIGAQMHEEPQIPNYGVAGKGPRLAAGMVFAIEPMINQGDWQVEVLLDNWTAVTVDRKLSAHYEHTVAITDGDPQILTLAE